MLSLLLSILSLFCIFIPSRAAIWTTAPSSCTAGATCTVEWLDDGNAPLLSNIGSVQLGVYTGELQLLQPLSDALDVAATSSFDFTPDASIGPNGGGYYIAFTPLSNTGAPGYIGFSGFFSLSGMTGSQGGPASSLTFTSVDPSTIASSVSGSMSTVTIGTLSSEPPISSISATSTESAGPSTTTIAGSTVTVSAPAPTTPSSSASGSSSQPAAASTTQSNGNVVPANGALPSVMRSLAAAMAPVLYFLLSVR